MYVPEPTGKPELHWPFIMSMAPCLVVGVVAPNVTLTVSICAILLNTVMFSNKLTAQAIAPYHTYSIGRVTLNLRCFCLFTNISFMSQV